MPDNNFNTKQKPPQGEGLNLLFALQLAARGWYVFPCNLDKTPRTRSGFNSASIEAEKIKAWGVMWEGGLIGIACEKSGFFAVDIDTKNGTDGRKTWQDLITAKGDGLTFDGPAQDTPSGGTHLLFTLPEGLKIPNNAGKLGAGLDLRSKGYICTGGAYHWQPGHTALNDLTPAPAWLLDEIRKLHGVTNHPPAIPLQTAGDRGIGWLNKALARASEGNRNETGLWLALQLRDDAIPQTEAAEIMTAYARGVPQSGDPYTEAEALNSLNIYKDPARAPAKRSRQSPQEAPLDGPQTPLLISTWQDMEGLVSGVTWAWGGWLPDGVLTILAGEPGSGKSILALRLAACFLLGLPFPDGKPFAGTPGAVIWCEAEAAQAINLQRAKAWGLPVEKIYTHSTNPLLDFALANQSHLDALRRRADLPEVRLIIIDSLSGSDSKAEKSSDDAASVKALAELGRDIKKPILLTHHLRKKSLFDGETIDIDRLRGSSAIVQTARMVWALDTPDPGAKNWRRLQVVKSNLAAFPDPVGMTIDGAGAKFGLAPSQPKVEGPIDRAIDLLRALLQNEPQPAELIQSEFDGAGISVMTMKRAKAKLGIISRKEKNGWYWSLPASKEYKDYVN